MEWNYLKESRGVLGPKNATHVYVVTSPVSVFLWCLNLNVYDHNVWSCSRWVTFWKCLCLYHLCELIEKICRNWHGGSTIQDKRVGGRDYWALELKDLIASLAFTNERQCSTLHIVHTASTTSQNCVISKY